MIFVIEKLFQDHQAQNDAWERARAKWVADGDYRSNRDYQMKHPRPGQWVGLVARCILAFLLIGSIVGAVVTVASQSNNTPTPNKPTQAVAKKVTPNCNELNLNDHVRIQYGDEAGDTGTLVGGCSGDQSYQVKLDRDQKDYEGNNRGEQIIEVSSRDNLVAVEKD